jgi:hypothetical protein
MIYRSFSYDFCGHPIYPINVLFMEVETNLIGDKQVDEKATGNADGKPYDVDHCKTLVLPKKPDVDFKA